MKLYRLAMTLSMCIMLAGCGQPEGDAVEDGRAVKAGTGRTANPVAAAMDQEAARAEAEAAERERIQRAEAERLDRIAKVRQADPALNWVSIGISTGKYSEDIQSTVHRTHAECAAESSMEDSTCIPIPKLPDSYWKAAE